MSDSLSPTDGLDRFAWRAGLLFTSLVVLDAVFVVTTLSKPDLPMVARVLYGLAPVAWSLLAVVLIIGLAWRTWAIPGSIVVLLGLIVAGAVMTIVELTQGRLHFPIGLVLAVIVVRSLPKGMPFWGRDRAARVAVAAALMVVAFVNAWPLAVDALLRPGGSPLSVGSEALALELRVDCSPPFAVGEPVPATVHVTWQLDDEWLTDGEDGMLVEWYAVTGSGESAYFSLDGYEAAVAGSGIWEADQNPGSASFGLEVRPGNQIDGMLDLTLRGDSRPHGELIVRTRYAHLDRWTKRSDWVTCAW